MNVDRVEQCPNVTDISIQVYNISLDRPSKYKFNLNGILDINNTINGPLTVSIIDTCLTLYTLCEK